MGTNPEVTGLGGRLFLIVMGLILGAAGVVFRLRPPQIGWVRTTGDARVLAVRVAAHPTDWASASALAEVALDAKVSNRVGLWRTSYELASLIAPERTDPAAGFARDAFFHWTELSPDDKRYALTVYSPIMQDPLVFRRMARPLFELTGDLSVLHRAGPPTAETPGTMIALALPNGLFADYRALRPELQKKRMDDFAVSRHAATPEELVYQFPAPPYHTDSEPLIRALLDELHRRPLEESPNRTEVVNGVVDYALRHDIGPLDGFEAITRRPGSATVETQIKIAQSLGLKQRASQLEMTATTPRLVSPNVFEWQGLCQNDVCTRAWRMIEAEHGIALTIETVQSDEVKAYVEIYVDDDLRAEGEVGAKRDFIVPAGNRGSHRVEVVLVNPTTRNGAPRRVHIASITTM